MSTDGKLNPLEGLSSPIGLGTLSVVLALTRAVQALAGKENLIVERALQDALTTEIFQHADPEVRKNFEAPIHQALKQAQSTREALQALHQS